MAEPEDPSSPTASDVRPKGPVPTGPDPAGGGLADYRKVLVAAEQKAQDDFDKTVLSLSGGALGISFVFLKDFVGSQAALHLPWALLGAWIAWGLSSLVVLVSYWTSNRAIRHALDRVDGKVKEEGPIGGMFGKITSLLNLFGALFFVVGVFLIVLFAGANLRTKGVTDAGKEGPSAASSAKASSACPCCPASPGAAARSGDTGQGRQGNP